MMVPGEKPFLDQRYVSGLMLLIFTLGTFTLVGLVVAAFIFCVYLLNLALDAFGQLAHSFTALYGQSDSFTKLIIWIVILLIVCKISPWIAGVVRRALHLA